MSAAEPEPEFDHQFPHLLYRCAVLRGAQAPVTDWWGRSEPVGYVIGVDRLAGHFYASTPPESILQTSHKKR